MNNFFITDFVPEFVQDFTYKLSIDLVDSNEKIEFNEYMCKMFNERKKMCLCNAEYLGVLEELEDEFAEFLSERHPDKVLKFEELQEKVLK
jgi:hypothetical protein